MQWARDAVLTWSVNGWRLAHLAYGCLCDIFGYRPCLTIIKTLLQKTVELY